jgi:hypothetical protein
MLVFAMVAAVLVVAGVVVAGQAGLVLVAAVCLIASGA